MTLQQQIESGLSHHRAGRLAEAEKIYRDVLAQHPTQAQVLNFLGVLSGQTGRFDEAMELIRRAISLNPNFAEAHNSLGNALARSGKLDQAIAAYRQAITLKPDLAEARDNLAKAHNNLGNILKDAGQLNDAVTAYRQAIELKPDLFEAHNNLGNVLIATGHAEKAVSAFERAIGLKPDFAEAHSNLANAFVEMGRFDEGIASSQKAIRLKPEYAEAHNSLGIALRSGWRLEEAIAAHQQALRLKPNYAEAHNNLGNALKEIGLIDQAVATYREAIRLKPDYVDARSNLVYTIQCDPRYDAKMIRDELRRWSSQHADPLRKFIQPHAYNRDPQRRLRIGYVSPDFRKHVVGQNLLPLLREHDHGQFEIFCYSNVAHEDSLTEQLRSCSDAWRRIVGLSDSQAADLIRKDGIDILVDLTLHTANNRLLIFVHKPAPVQVTYLGYCSSTGLETMDYRLSDPYLDPPDSDLSQYSERTIRLPETYWCYSPGGPTPEPSPPPAQTAGHVTFGCLNSFAKVSPTLDLWAEILQSLPGSRLIIHAPPGTHLNDVRERFSRKDIAPGRLEFTARQSWSEYVQTYARIDIALDPFPWGGGITTCDALWMGVPVVTLVGQTAVGRGGSSILSNIGAPELIARTPQQYLQIASDLAKDLPRLAKLRRTLRPRMQASPLMNAPRFARNIEAAYRQMWQTWCAGGGLQTESANQMTLEQQFETGLTSHRARRLADAERIYRDILRRQPNHADALHMLGSLAGEVGQFDIAVELIQRAIAIRPNKAAFFINLGNVQRATGQSEQATVSYRQAIQIRPDFAEAYSNLGNALTDLGKIDEAIDACQRAIALKPDFAHAHFSLGVALSGAGKIDQAIASYRQAVEIQPDFADAHNNLGAALKKNGQLDEAVASYRRAIVAKPDFADAHSNLGIALMDIGRHEEAVASLRQAIRLKPDHPEAQNNLGILLTKLGQPDEAINSLRAAIRLRSDYAEAQANLGAALAAVGQIDEALIAFRRAMVLKPDLAGAHTNLLCTIQCHPGYDGKMIQEEHRRWNQRCAAPLKQFITRHINNRDPDRRLRIGYLSADFRNHVVGQNLLPLLREHDHGQMEIFCYSSVTRGDALTERLRHCSDAWRDIVRLSDSQAADLIRQDRIDILVDLGVHTSGNRLLIFAHKPAPVQVTYLGYCGSTGLETMDYRLSDPYLDPLDSDLSLYNERTIRLPSTYWCYTSVGPTPEPSPPPAEAAGHITFGCLNNFAKVSPALDLWAAILQSVTRSRLIVHSHPGTHLDAVRQQFARNGISPDRLEFPGQQAWPEYVRTYDRIDIALDPFPWGGGITTCDALWMGVPVVTLVGQTAVGRGGFSILSNIGAPELIAKTPQQYLQIASHLAKDLPRLAELRRTLRPRMQASPLMDAPRFARDVEAAYRQMWHNWISSSHADA